MNDDVFCKPAWLYHYGQWPDQDIDHINGDGTDNRICNLRLASDSENLCNRSKSQYKLPSAAALYKGVNLHRTGRWRAYIAKDNQYIHLGMFGDEESAARAYDKAARHYHGAFAVLNFPDKDIKMTTEPEMQVARIEDKIDRAALDSIAISPTGSLILDTFGKMMEMAKVLAAMDIAVPPHVRNNRAISLAVVVQANEWQISPLAVAKKSYVVKAQNGESTLNYESQLIHAVIERRAPIKGRLAVRYEGEGDKRICIVSGQFNDEDMPREWRSPPLGRRRPDKGRGSPLWHNGKEDLALFYDTSRDWCRAYCPDVILGIYARDEMEESAQIVDFPRVVNPLGPAPVSEPPPPPPVAAAPDPEPEYEPEPEPPMPLPAERPKRGRKPKAPAATFASGDLVALNTPSPPLRVSSAEGDKIVHRGDIQQGDVGEVMGPPNDAGKYPIAWRTLPGYHVSVHGTSLLPATSEAAAIDEPLPAGDVSFDPETGEINEPDGSPDEPMPALAPAPAPEPPPPPQPDETFGEPKRKTAADYDAYARRWMARALREQWTYAAVEERYKAEKPLRNTLGLGFMGDEWRRFQEHYFSILAQLTPPE
jgi:hypothetical protein